MFHEGDSGDCMYVLLEGSVDVRVGETLVESGTPGALLGEMALVDSSARTATIVATAPAGSPKLISDAFTSWFSRSLFCDTCHESSDRTIAPYEFAEQNEAGRVTGPTGRLFNFR